MKKTYMFPGQGSQKAGMGDQLFDEFPELTKSTDKILGYSIKELCLNDPEKKLNQTQFTQPALYVVNALSYQKKIKESGKKPDFVAGHSLGEYNALEAAGFISFKDGLKLVKKRGELMSKAKGGGMAAIINSSKEQISQILKDAKLDNIDIANLNSPSQIVISGLKDDIKNSQPHFEKAGVMFIPLNTSGAFHSRYMKDAEKEFGEFIKQTKFSEPEMPVIANFTAKPYTMDSVVVNLTSQISNCVRWTDSIFYLLDQGEMEFEELGVGDVLTKLVRTIEREYKKNKPVAKESSENKAETKEKSTTANSKNVKIKDTSDKKENKQKVGQANPDEIVEQWNKTYPVGTKVKVETYEEVLETRTEAVLLFGHRTAVYMKGYNGYFDLKEVVPVP